MLTVQEWVTAVRHADHDFEPEIFLQLAEVTFLLVKHAYQHRDVEAGRS